MKKNIHSSKGCAILSYARRAGLGIITYII